MLRVTISSAISDLTSFFASLLALRFEISNSSLKASRRILIAFLRSFLLLTRSGPLLSIAHPLSSISSFNASAETIEISIFEAFNGSVKIFFFGSSLEEECTLFTPSTIIKSPFFLFALQCIFILLL